MFLEYSFKQKLGTGASGDVYGAVHRETKKVYAVKVVNLEDWEKEDLNCDDSLYNLLKPIITKLNCKQLYRAQLNLHPKTFFKRYNAYHRDQPLSHKGCLLYLNTNNGNTIIKNGIFGKKFKSIANRALMFDPSIIHQSTTCTDKDFRALLVLNYS